MKTFFGKDIISIKDLTKKEILQILKIAREMKRADKSELLSGKVMGSLFFEPSTRTRLSFETAMKRLGGKVIGFAEAASTAVSKGESFYDSIKIIGQYVDVIIIRHPKEGAARLASEATTRPVINAGDGANQHPTQTLLDLFTILETQKKLNNLSVALVGDLKYGRTVHSLTLALSMFSVKLYFVAPPSLQIPAYILDELKKRKVKYSLHERFERIIPKVDILYMTRIQKERFPDPLDYEKVKNVYVLTLNHLIHAKKSLKILHPLPRVNEIASGVDKTPFAHFFQQAQNGLYVRQALLGLVLGKI